MDSKQKPTVEKQAGRGPKTGRSEGNRQDEGPKTGRKAKNRQDGGPKQAGRKPKQAGEDPIQAGAGPRGIRASQMVLSFRLKKQSRNSDVMLESR